MRYIIDGEDAIAVHWLRAGADGWRLDVVDELPDSFVMRLRDRIRAEKPDALLIGEVWEDASNKIAYGVRRRYFVDRELDSVMNYPWQKEILRFVRGEADGSDLGERIMTLAENYPADARLRDEHFIDPRHAAGHQRPFSTRETATGRSLPSGSFRRKTWLAEKSFCVWRRSCSLRSLALPAFITETRPG